MLTGCLQLPEDDVPLLSMRPAMQAADGEGEDTLDAFIQQSLPGGQKIENAQQVCTMLLTLSTILIVW